MGFLYSQLFVKPGYPTRMLNGQTIIVTGSNTGLGKEAARHFARLGAAKVILAVRNTKAGEAAKADIEQTTQCTPGTVEVWPLDLGDYASVKAFAARATKELERIDVLCENAGIAADNKKMVSGHESTLTVNVVSTFLLALLMLPKLRETAKKFPGARPRLTVVASEVHGWAKFPERDEPNIFAALDRSEDMSERYSVSKLLEVLVIRQIAPRVKGGVTLNMLNPGLCHSELSRDAGLGLTVMKFLLARSTEVGSRTLVAAGLAGEESHGKYMSDGVVAEQSLSAFVRSDEGDRVGKKVWKELGDILDKIEPGVTANL